MASTHASKEVVWLQRLCSEIGFKQQAMRIDYDRFLWKTCVNLYFLDTFQSTKLSPSS